MIHVRVSRALSQHDAEVMDLPRGITEMHISVTEESMDNFKQLIDRALNCWDSAPQELKELGDMLTHGRITQPHEFQPINTKQSSDYYTVSEAVALMQIFEEVGEEKRRQLMEGDRVELHKLLQEKLGKS
jgi:RNAse (barnase) inhibitor barstar